jgi:hypothetical protein
MELAPFAVKRLKRLVPVTWEGQQGLVTAQVSVPVPGPLAAEEPPCSLNLPFSPAPSEVAEILTVPPCSPVPAEVEVASTTVARLLPRLVVGEILTAARCSPVPAEVERASAPPAGSLARVELGLERGVGAAAARARGSVERWAYQSGPGAAVQLARRSVPR